MTATSVFLMFGVVAAPLPPTDSPVDAHPPSDKKAATTLVQLVEAYFQTTDKNERQGIAHSVDAASGGSIEAVAQAIRSAKLWTAQPLRAGTLTRPTGNGGARGMAYRLPADYDPLKPYTVVLIVNDGDATAMVQKFVERVGDLCDHFILVCPDDWPEKSLRRSGGESEDFREMIRDIRRSFHTDTDRMYLYGANRAGDSAWLTAVLYRDLFAGLFTDGAFLDVPYAEYLYPLLIPQLSGTRILTVWSRSPTAQPSDRNAVVAAHNLAVMEIARHAKLQIESIQTRTGDEPGGQWSREALERFFAHTREPLSDRVSHWFRYPEQGCAGWLRQDAYLGDIWTTDQLSILPGPAIDRDTFIRDVLAGHLAHLSGQRVGTVFRIETSRCAQVSLRLPPSFIREPQPITVYCNGTQRFHKPVTGSVRALLEHAYKTWDPNRLVAAELSFSIRRNQP